MSHATKLSPMLIAAVALASPALAADGTWTNPAGGTWSDADTGNWDGGIVAEGADFTADFSTLDISGHITVSLSEPRTIGNLVFGDTDTGTIGRWTLNDGGDASNVLTLAGTAPTITNNVAGNDSRVVISAVIDGSDGLTTAGPGSVIIFTGANTYSGGTTISTGSLRAQNDSALGTGEVTVAAGARLELQNVNLANTINLNGNNALFRSGGANQNVELSGIVNLQSDSRASMTSSNNGNMIFSGTLNLAGNTFTTSTRGSSHVEITGTITGGGGITKIDSGNLYITGDNAATYTGTTRLERGTLLVGHDNALGSGTFQFVVNNDTTARIRSTDATTRTIANAVTISAQHTGNVNARHQFGTDSSGDLIFTGDVSIIGNRKFQVDNTTSFNGLVTGGGGITLRQSSGTLMLNGLSDYAGDTTLETGTLLVNGEKTGSGNVTVEADAILGGTGSIAGDVVFQEGGIFLAQTAGPLNIDGTINATGAIISTNDTLTLNSYTVLTHGLDALTGTFTVDASIADLGYSVIYGDTNVSLVIPEPASIVLMGVGGLLMVRRRPRS